MKYTIFGFDQARVLELSDEKQSIDERDLMILRWFMDWFFSDSMKKVVHDGSEYGLIRASKVADDLPIMRIEPTAVRRRLKKLVKFGLLADCFVKEDNGNACYYRPTSLASSLQGTNHDTLKYQPHSTSKDYPPSTSEYAYSSTNNTSTINNEREGGKRKRFTPPTLEEVAGYCEERGNGIDPERFIDYYESNGWMVGKNRMKDWRAAVRTWERRDGGKPAPSKPKPGRGRRMTVEELLRLPFFKTEEEAQAVLDEDGQEAYTAFWVRNDWGHRLDNGGN